MAGGVTCRASLPQEGGPRCTPCLYRQAILGRIRPILVSHAVDLATATTSHDDGRAKPTSPLAQHSLRQLERQAPTRQTTSRSWTRGATTPTRWAQPCGGLPTAALPNLTSTGHRGRGDARTADAHRGPDAEHRRPASGQHRTLDTGRVDRQAWTLVARTGHWTPDAGRGRGQGDDGTAGIQTSWTTTPGDRALGRPTVFLWTGPAGLGSPCRLGSKVTCRRETASRTTMQRSVAPPA
jgi:hypothetical protein